jgi:hypothetical protein
VERRLLAVWAEPTRDQATALTATLVSAVEERRRVVALLELELRARLAALNDTSPPPPGSPA